ncbi:MAG: hypothetical protein A2078_14625 [Nitrospirae bacterium GWC2_57_9]|nr:MAG: hypothetical protein A2078_14625 [Nitrospirae bacterium GWC2_57_9]
MKINENRARARQILISGDWFLPPERIKLRAMLGLDSEIKEQLASTCRLPHQKEIRQGRDIRFRLQLVPLYRYACALCNVKMLLPSGVTLVEAAHIHQFSDSHNDDVANGIALCRNHHWSFDQGLWTMGTDHRVVVATGRFLENSPHQLSLSEHDARRLDFSWLATEHWPSQKNLEWHRKHKFIGTQD